MKIDTRRRCCQLHDGDRSREAIMATEWHEPFWVMLEELLPDDLKQGKNLAGLGRFKELCQDAMFLSHFKYGHVMNSAGKIEFTATIVKRIELYELGGWQGDVEVKAGNVEFMTDVYNFAMIEFMHNHQGRDPRDGKLFDAGGTRTARMKTICRKYRAEDGPCALLKVAAMAVAEFVQPKHKKAHYKGLDNASPGVAVKDEDDPVFLQSNSLYW